MHGLLSQQRYNQDHIDLLEVVVNLFDLSPRELTNSAVWMWLLSGLGIPGSIRHRIAVDLLTDLGVPVPDSVQELRTEYALPDGRRIDM